MILPAYGQNIFLFYKVERIQSMFAHMIWHDYAHVNTLNSILLLQKGHNLSKTQTTSLDFYPNINFALHVNALSIYPAVNQRSKICTQKKKKN